MSAGLRLVADCACGAALPVATEEAFSCPGCGRGWQLDASSKAQVASMSAGLRRTQLLAIGAPAAVALVVVVVAVLWAGPQLLLTLPLAVGLVAVLLRRQHQRSLRGRYAEVAGFAATLVPVSRAVSLSSLTGNTHRVS